MSLNRIAYKLYCTPWLVKDNYLKSMQAQFEAYSKKVSVLEDMMPDDDEEEEPEAMTGPVRVINIDGTLGLHLSMLETMCGGVDYTAIRGQLKQYRDDPTCESIVMLINSPGGMVTGCKETANLVSEVASIKPVITYVDGMCCSAAYWIASQSTAIYCSESSDIGSIGCIMTHADYSRQLENDGITVTAIKSNEYKDIGSPHRPMTEAEYNILLADVKSIEAEFIATIQSKRDIKTEVLNGLTHNGNQSVELGFADGIVNDLEDLLETIKQ